MRNNSAKTATERENFVFFSQMKPLLRLSLCAILITVHGNPLQFIAPGVPIYQQDFLELYPQQPPQFLKHVDEIHRQQPPDFGSLFNPDNWFPIEINVPDTAMSAWQNFGDAWSAVNDYFSMGNQEMPQPNIIIGY